MITHTDVLATFLIVNGVICIINVILMHYKLLFHFLISGRNST